MGKRVLSILLVALGAAVAAPGVAHAAWPGPDGLIAVGEGTLDPPDLMISFFRADGTRAGSINNAGFDTNAAFDPTGERIAYIHLSSARATDYELRERRIADPASDHLVVAASGGDIIDFPEYTADGKRLSFFAIRRGNPDRRQVEQVNLDGSGDTVVIAPDVLNAPIFAGPAGLYAFRGSDLGPFPVRATADPNAPTPIDLDPRMGTISFVGDASPDGQSILYEGDTEDSECSLAYFEAPAGGGTGTMRIPIGCRQDRQTMAYAPAGGRIAIAGFDFSDGAPLNGHLSIGNLATGAITPIADVFALSVDWGRAPRQTTTLTAKPAVASILAPGLSVNLRLEATLTASGTPVAGKQIVFRNGKGTVLCTATTNAAGTATCTSLQPLLGAVLNLGYDAQFAGDDSYKPSSAHAGIVQIGGIRLF